MRIAVTGGSGEFGGKLIPYLREQGHAVVSIDRIPPTMAGSERPLLPEYVIADTRNFGEFVACIRGCDALIHLAAHRSPVNAAEWLVYNENTASSYNALCAAATLGIRRVCLASSVNAIGGIFSRSPRYDYFPVDEQHPSYAEDPYSLSKWVLEQQADAFARRYESMSIASLRFHMLIESYELAAQWTSQNSARAARHLWAYTAFADASRACLLSLTSDFVRHQVFYIVAPRTAASETSLDLARQYYPNTEIRGDLSDYNGFFNCAKAQRILGWRHEG